MSDALVQGHVRSEVRNSHSYVPVRYTAAPAGNILFDTATK